MSTAVSIFKAHPELAIFVAVVLGFFIGRVHVKGVGLGTVVGTLLAGLGVGILTEPVIPDLLKWAFFDLFLFAIGYGTGPQFFAGLRKEAAPQIVLALVVSLTGLLAALGVAWVFRLDAGFAAGVASGGLTQSAALGTAIATINQLPLSEAARAQLAAHVPIADAVTYLFGDIGVILFVVGAAPLLLRMTVQHAAVDFERQLAARDGASLGPLAYERFGYRSYRLTNPEIDGRTVHELERSFGHGRAYVERIRRGDAIVAADAHTRLALGDVLAVGARRAGLVEAHHRIGPEIDDEELLAFPVADAAVVVSRRTIAGHTIDSLDARYGHGVFLRKLTRGQEELPLAPKTKVMRGDVLHITASLPNLERAVRQAGFIDPDPGRFALPLLAAGLVAGTLIGLLHVRVGTMPIGLGTSCAVLLTGLVTGWARSRYPLFGGIPDAATRMLQDVGLTVFIAIIGLTAGPHAVAVWDERGSAFFLTIFVAGAIVTLVPQVVGFFVGYRLLRMPVAMVLGGLAGAQTATPALNALKEAGGNNVFVLGFTIPYAINNVLLTLWGTVVVTVVHSWGR